MKLETALKGRAVNVNGEKLEITKLDRANGAYILEDGTVVPADQLMKKGRGLFFTPKRGKKVAAKKEVAAKPAAKKVERNEPSVAIDRELKGKFITLNPGTRNEDKQKIVGIVKGEGYKLEDGTIIAPADVFKKGRGVFAVTSKKAAKTKVAEAVSKANKTSGLKPKAEVAKVQRREGGLKPKAEVTRKRVKVFDAETASEIESRIETIIEREINEGDLADLDIQLAAVRVVYMDNKLIAEAGIVSGSATEEDVQEILETMEAKGDDDLDDDLTDEEELDEEELDEEELDEEELDDEESDEDEEDEEDEDELDEEDEDELDEDELDDEESDEEEEDEEDEESDEEEEDEEDEESDEEEEDDFEDEEESDEEDEESEEDEDDLEEMEDEDEEDEEEIDFSEIAKRAHLKESQVAKYGQNYVDSDFDLSTTLGSRVKDDRSGKVYFFIGSTTDAQKTAKAVVAAKGANPTAVSIDTFVKHFNEV